MLAVLQVVNVVTVGCAGQAIEPLLRQRHRRAVAVVVGDLEATGIQMQVAAVEEDFPHRELKCRRMHLVAEGRAVGFGKQLAKQRERRIVRQRRRIHVVRSEREVLSELDAPEDDRIAIPRARKPACARRAAHAEPELLRADGIPGRMEIGLRSRREDQRRADGQPRDRTFYSKHR